MPTHQIEIPIDEYNQIVLTVYPDLMSISLNYKHPRRKGITRASVLITKEQALCLAHQLRVEAGILPLTTMEKADAKSETKTQASADLAEGRRHDQAADQRASHTQDAGERKIGER